jgi:membrane protease YdiL (CAAX protease family)
MNVPDGEQGRGWIEALSLLVLAATLAPWVWMVRRLVARRPILPYQPRRPVPWGGLDIVLVLFCLYGAAGLALACERPLLDGWAQRHYGAEPPEANPGTEHSLFLVLKADPSLLTLALCFFSAAVVAPIGEEFFFRLLLQGWLERLERRLRRRVRALRWLAPGVLSIVVTAAIFASRHYRAAPEGAEPDVVTMFHLLVAGGIGFLLAVVFGIVLVRIRAGATVADLGFVPARFWADVRLGLVAAAAVTLPILTLHLAVQSLLQTEPVQEMLTRLGAPAQVAADPVPIFFLALALGTLYSRTHRIVPSITLHVAFNLTSLTLAWLSVGA